MRDWLPYTAAFGLALASAMGGYFIGFMIVMSGTSFGMAGFFVVTILLPLAVALAVFVISYSAFSDQWIGWTGGLMAAAFVFVIAFICFVLIVQDLLEEVPAAILLAVTIFVGGRFLLKRASLD
ncbi:hypothetical protein [Yoonia sp.]|uniref:hypothetical protein n=1 Tax=Yoonia sp. TaxID=2212373 RepID=UPI00358EA3D7